MKKHIINIALIISLTLLSLLFLSSCEEKFDLSQLPDPTKKVNFGDTSYVEIQPPWGGFQSPRAVFVGYDQLIYVADYDANEIVMMNAGGVVLKRRAVSHPISLAQNSKLELYVGAESLAPNGIDTVGTLFKISLVRFDTTYVAGYTVDTVTHDTTFIIRDTSYFFSGDLATAPMRAVMQETAHPNRRFVGIGMLPGNSYLVARSGPDNSSFVDPDTRVLIFSKDDVLQTLVSELNTQSSGGSAINDINQLTGLLTFPSSSDFIVTQSNDAAYGAIWMIYQTNPTFTGWVAKFDPLNAIQSNIDFLRFQHYDHAIGATVDKRRLDVFILDEGVDSVLKFDRNGKFKTESFGRYRTVETFVTAHGDTTVIFPGLNHPRGIAFSTDCTLYIADTGNQVIRRFKIPSQTNCN